MTTPTAEQSRADVVSGAWRRRAARKTLLLAGIASVAIYAAGDLVSGLLYDGYSFRDQAISELSAYGSPVRRLAVSWIALHGLLVLAFCLGIWRSAGGRKALRWTAGLLIAAGVVTLPLHPFFPMSSRGMETGFNDTTHIVVTVAFGLLVFGAVAASAVAVRGWFRLYAILSLAVIAGFAGMTGPLMRNIANNMATPWLGAFERVNAYGTFAWMVVLAVVLLRCTDGPSERVPEAERLAAHRLFTARPTLPAEWLLLERWERPSREQRGPERPVTDVRGRA